MQLAADLGTALKQAMFASAVLSQMKEEANEGGVRYFVGQRELSPERVVLLQSCVDEAKKAGIVEDWEVIAVKRSRLQMLVVELLPQPMERLQEIAGNYKDLIMSKTLVDLVRERLHAMARRNLDARGEENKEVLRVIHASKHAILINLVRISQALVKETQVLGFKLELSIMEIVRSVYKVPMDPFH